MKTAIKRVAILYTTRLAHGKVGHGGMLSVVGKFLDHCEPGSA
jgi:hypothetical protein